MTVTVEKDGSDNDYGKEPPTEAATTDDFDTILTRVGTGRWNAVYYIAIAYWHLCLPYHTLAGAFISPSMNYTCLPPAQNITLPGVPIVAQGGTDNSTNAFQLYDISCSYQKKDEATGKLEYAACTEWEFDTSIFTSTVTSEFSLVCERRYLRAAHQSIYMGGILVGAFFNGFLADRYGRLTMIAISTAAYSLIALGSAWLPSLGSVLASRFLLGTMHPTFLTTGFILVMEVSEIKWRSTMGLLTGSLWSVGTALWGLFAYLERDWRWLQTYVSLLCPLFLPALFFLQESPRWLVVMGRHKKALSILQRAAKINGTSLPPDDRLLAIMKKVQEKSTSHEAHGNRGLRMADQVTILFKNWTLATITVVMCIGFFAVAMIFFGLTLGATALDVDPFAYVGISGAVELPAILTIFMVEIFGRKKSGIGTFGLCAVSLLMQPVIPANLKWLSITLVMVGKMAASCAFDVMFLYSSELYPTEIRTQGLCAGLMSSRAGAFISPFIMSALEPHHSWAISVVFGLTAAVAAVAFAPLWETVNICLPDTVAQLEERLRLSRLGDRDSSVYKSPGSEETVTSC